MRDNIAGRVIDCYNGRLVIEVVPGTILSTGTTVDIAINDINTITAQQRKFCYAIFNSIAKSTGYDISDVKQLMKAKFLEGDNEYVDWFSLSNMSRKSAKDFLTYLLEFCIENDVELEANPVNYDADVYKIVYAEAIHRKCCICGLPNCDLHHVDSVGANGGSRDEINHLGLKVLPLCRTHHNLIHNKGDESFTNYFHVVPVEVDKHIAKANNLHIK